MTDEGWDILPPNVRVAILAYGEKVMGPDIYKLSKEMLYAFAERALEHLKAGETKMDDGVVEYEEAMRSADLMGG